jgi:hypothetical protein
MCKLGRKSKCERKSILRKKRANRQQTKAILKEIALTENQDLADNIENDVAIPYNG